MAVKERVGARIESARDRWPLLDHAVRIQEHYIQVNAGAQAGAVTYYAFLSFFPILALAFFVVGWIARYFPDAQQNLVDGIEQIFPGMIGPDEGQISLKAIQNAATAVGIVGVITLVYSGLGWLSSMRKALQVVFELPQSRKPSFVLGKLRDLLTLVVVGTGLLLSVAVSGVVTRFSNELLDLAHLDQDLSSVVDVLALIVAMAASTLLFFVLFTILARPRIPDRSLWQGAFLGAVAFEVLKQLSSYLLAITEQSPAFQAFGIALILLIWINYFSRVVMYAAAWAYTAPAARAQRATQEPPVSATSRPAPPGVPTPADVGPAPPPSARNGRLDPRLAFAAGAAVALGLVAMARRRRG